MSFFSSVAALFSFLFELLYERSLFTFTFSFGHFAKMHEIVKATNIATFLFLSFPGQPTPSKRTVRIPAFALNFLSFGHFCPAASSNICTVSLVISLTHFYSFFQLLPSRNTFLAAKEHGIWSKRAKK